MARTVRARHARFVVLYTSGPDVHMPAGERWAPVVSDAAAQAGADYFSLDDQGRLGPAMFAPDKIHWNAAGNRAVYSYIAPRIAPLLRADAAGASSKHQPVSARFPGSTASARNDSQK